VSRLRDEIAALVRPGPTFGWDSESYNAALYDVLAILAMHEPLAPVWQTAQPIEPAV
jgi:hypothetical protein